MLGDFNLVLNPKKDRHNSNSNNKKACSVLKELMEEWNIVDVWRDRNPNGTVYTWFRGDSQSENYAASRIDNILCSRGLDAKCEMIDFLPGLFSDHRAIYACFKENNHETRERILEAKCISFK